MAFDGSESLHDRFEHARQSLVEMFPAERRAGKTYQGFVKARRRLSPEMVEHLQGHLRQCHRQVPKRYWQRFGWIPFAADGSRVEVPRTAANEAAFGCAGRNKTGPQLLLTTVYHMGSGLPWDWRIGPGTDGERAHFRSMLAALPAGSLLVADAGFTGYELFGTLLERGGVLFDPRRGERDAVDRIGSGSETPGEYRLVVAVGQTRSGSAETSADTSEEQDKTIEKI